MKMYSRQAERLSVWISYLVLLHLTGKRRLEPEDEEEEIEMHTVSTVTTKPSPMPNPCSSEVDAMMLGETLSPTCR